MVNVAWVVLHCNRRIGARERRQLIPHVRFQVPFLGPESQLKSGFVCAGLLCSNSICLLLTKPPWTGYKHAVVIFCLLHGSAVAQCRLLFFRFCGLIFGTARRSQKWDRESAFLLFFYFAVHAVPKMGPPGGPIFGTVFRLHFLKFFVSRLQKRNVLVSMKLCGLWQPEGQLGRPF